MIVKAIFVPSITLLDRMDKALEFLPKVEDYGYFNREI
jgi:hypothetical protein